MNSISINYQHSKNHRGGRPHYINGNRPVTLGSKKDDVFALDSRTRGVFKGGKGNDTFDYGNDPGTLKTTIRGGRGEDTFALSKLKVGDALKALKNQGYSFVQLRDDLNRGFGLRTRDGENIKVFNIERLAFKDRTFNLKDENDVNQLVSALEDNGIEIIDETDRNNRNRRRARFAFRHEPSHHSYGNVINHPHPYSDHHNHSVRQNNFFGNAFNRTHRNSFPSHISNLSPEQAYILGTQQAGQNGLFNNNFGFYSNAVPANSIDNRYGWNQSPYLSYGNPFFQNPVYSHPTYAYSDPSGPGVIRVPASAMLAHEGSGFGNGLTSTRFDRNRIYDFSNSTNNFNFYLDSSPRTSVRRDVDYSFRQPIATPRYSYRAPIYTTSSININNNQNSSSISNSNSIFI